MTGKYIKTSDDRIIVFPLSVYHIDFQSFQPKSAGFISITTDEFGELIVRCWGKSEGLELESKSIDEKLAYTQFKKY